jgi:hypothetical protein
MVQNSTTIRKQVVFGVVFFGLGISGLGVLAASSFSAATPVLWQQFKQITKECVINKEGPGATEAGNAGSLLLSAASPVMAAV